MWTHDALLDALERTHRSFAGLIEHCAGFSTEEFDRSLDGFGYGSVRLQLHHAIAAQRYWIGVLEGRTDDDEDADRYPTAESLADLLREVRLLTEGCILAIPESELSVARTVETWGGRTVDIAPAPVVMRTLTHLFQHQGQVAALCRLLGRPIPAGLDFPLTDPAPDIETPHAER